MRNTLFDNPWFLSRGRALTQFTLDSTKEYNDRKIKILSIGAGFGYNLYALSESFPDSMLFACEPDKSCQPFLEKINASIFPFILNDLGKVEQVRNNGPFDMIMMSHVIEHFADPVENMRICLSLLEKNGILVIEVPNCQGPVSSWNVAPHISFFTPNTLEKVISQSGGKILKIDTCGPLNTTMMESSIKKVLKSVATFLLPAETSEKLRQRFSRSTNTSTDADENLIKDKLFIPYKEFGEYGGKNRIFIRALVRPN